MSFKPKFYTCDWPEDEPRGVFQRETSLTNVIWEREPESRSLPEPICRLAMEEYHQQFGTRQSYERMQERGGLGILEMVRLLADYVERLKYEKQILEDGGKVEQ